MERTTETDVSSVTVQRTSDGQLRQNKYSAPLEVRAYHHVTETDDDGDEEIVKSWEARFKYRVDDGRAQLIQVKDPDGSDCGSNWTGFGFLRCLAGVEDSLKNIDGVEEVEKAETTIGRQLERGRDAEFNPE